MQDFTILAVKVIECYILQAAITQNLVKVEALYEG